MSLSTIYEPIQENMYDVESSLKSVIDVGFPWLSELLGYSLKGSGKRIRPALVLLSGKFYDYNLERLLPMATAVELLHTATLVHDDAIDKSAVRRGMPTINKLWGEDKAVLLGDYLFARAGEFSAATQNLQVVKLFTQTLGIISSGELNQAFNAFNLEQTYEQYLYRISSKTASLFSLPTEAGAILSGAPEKAIGLLQQYGYNLGIAFQIVDDILDFIATEEELGKPVGSDLAQGTFTLPAMLLLERYPEDNPVKKVFQNEDTQKNIALAIDMVRNSSIVEECYEAASGYCSKASQSLDQLPQNASHRALKELADFVIRRKK